MSSKFKNAISKLARGNPEFRSALETELKKIGALSLGDTKEIENSKIRMRRSMTSVRVTDLTNAGKRGKKVDEFAAYDLDYLKEKGWVDELVQAVEKASSYRDAVAVTKKMIDDYEGGPTPKLEERQLRGIDVNPAGMKAIKINGKHVNLEADLLTFTVKDKDDTNNEPTCIPAIKGGKDSIKLFFRWVQDNESKIKTMLYREVLNAMRVNGIAYHDYCAMD